MNLTNLIEICKAYRNLGPAVQEQLDEVVEDPSENGLSGLNVNALAAIHEFLVGYVDPRVEEAKLVADDVLRYVEGYDGHPSGVTIRYGRIAQSST